MSFLLFLSFSLALSTRTHRVRFLLATRLLTNIYSSLTTFFISSPDHLLLLKLSLFAFLSLASSSSPATLPVSTGAREQEMSINNAPVCCLGGLLPSDSVFFQLLQNPLHRPLLCSPSSVHHARVKHSKNIGP